MGQQFANLSQMRLLAGLLQEIQQQFKGGNIFPHVPDQAMQCLQNLGRIARQHAFGVRSQHLQSIFILPGCHKRIRISSNSAHIVVHRGQLVGNAAGFVQVPGLQIRLQ